MRFISNDPNTDLTYSDVFLVPNSSALTSGASKSTSTTDPTGSTRRRRRREYDRSVGRRMAGRWLVAGTGGAAPDIPLTAAQETIAWVKSRDRSSSPLCASHPRTQSSTPCMCWPSVRTASASPPMPRTAEGIINAADLRGVDRFTSVAELPDSSPHVIRAPRSTGRTLHSWSPLRVDDGVAS